MVTANIATKPEHGEGSAGEAPIRNIMLELLNATPTPPQAGDLIEGIVFAKEQTVVYVDCAPFGTGVIYGREFLNARDIIKKMKTGEAITAKVIELENENGYIELSLREAKQAVLWQEAEEAIRKKTVFELPVKDANKGGLMLEWQGVFGFLPASQLKPEHYPRVEDGDKEKIMVELQKLVGEILKVSIITADPEEGKLIFSEKTPASPERQRIVSKYNVGDIVEGEVTGAVDFGVFIKIEEGLEGLVHISELDWSLVENPRDLYRPGEQVKAKVIEIKDDKISLSVKALKKNPWVEAEGKYKRGDVVAGVVIKFNKYGALVSIEEGVAGLIHISEFTSEKELHEALELGRTYDFRVSFFEPKEHRLTLTLADKPAEPDTSAETTAAEEESRTAEAETTIAGAETTAAEADESSPE